MATIVEIATRLPGAFCGSLFCQAGGLVYKIQDPVNLASESLMLRLLNAKKKPAMVDFKNKKKTIEELFISADVVITDLRETGSLGENIGELVKEARNRNPKLIWVNITDFGTGPYENYKSSEKVLNSFGGFAYFQGDRGREPLLGPGGRSYMIIGLYAYLTAAAALIEAERTDQNQDIEISGMEVLASMLMATPNEYDYSGFVWPRGIRSGSYPIGLFQVGDGHVAITTISPDDWKRLAEFIGGKELAEDPRYDSGPKRFERRDEIGKIMDAKFGKMSKDEVFKQTQEASITSGKVSTLEDLLNCPQLNSRGFWLSQEEEGRKIRMPNLNNIIKNEKCK